MRKWYGVAFGVLLMSAGAALAVADLPTRLSQRQAAAVYAGVRPLLENEGKICPAGQRPMFGRISGGSAPGVGSKTTDINFDKGAHVHIVQQWNVGDGVAAASSVRIDCDEQADTMTLDTSLFRGKVMPEKDLCREVEASLRAAPSKRCTTFKN